MITDGEAADALSGTPERTISRHAGYDADGLSDCFVWCWVMPQSVS